MTPFAAPIAEAIWDMKYRFKQADGTPIDATVEDSWRRIARALAELRAGRPALLDVVVTPEAASSDAKSGLAWVPDLQALGAWDEAEWRWRAGAG